MWQWRRRRAIDMARETGDDLSLISSLNTKGRSAAGRANPTGSPSWKRRYGEPSRVATPSRRRRALNNMTATAMDWMDLDRAGELSQCAMQVAALGELLLLEYRCKEECAAVWSAKGEWTTAENLALEMIGSHTGQPIW